jgi:hypothetical protein
VPCCERFIVSILLSRAEVPSTLSHLWLPNCDGFELSDIVAYDCPLRYGGMDELRLA